MSDYVAGGRSERTVPRTTDQTGAANVAQAISRRSALPAAIWGMIMLIASEGTLLGSFIASYYYLWSQAPRWPPLAIERPDVAVPLILAGTLALTSIPMQLASMAGRAGQATRAFQLVLVALVVQCGYFAYEMHSFIGDLGRFQPTTNAYGSIYYLLLGADHGHVFIGLLLNLWIVVKLVRGLTTYRCNALQAITWYWHAVNLLTLIIIGSLVSATL